VDTEPVFRALSDPSRRLLLDRLFERDGQTLGRLCEYLPGMTRFGVMNHLRVLEEAGLVTTRKVGREKLHYLNPVPIRLIHDRWISKYAAPVVGGIAALAAHLEGRTMAAPIHIYATYIRATPEAIWRAITDGDETVRYYYGTRVSSGWTVGSPLSYLYPDGSVAADGEVLAVDPPHRLEMSFHARWDPELEAEGPVTMTWQIEPAEGDRDGVSKLTVVTEGFSAGSRTESEFTGGIVWIVSGLKTVLETRTEMVTT
jgi:DNA-binding transcriptional ArsR family regulator